jgi:hypothetical protein
MKWDNFSIMAFKFLEKILFAKGINNVKFNYTTNEYHFINMNNCKILACHSDTLRSYSPTSQSERSKIQSICIGLFNQYYNHCITGHIHKANACMNEYGGYNISNGTNLKNARDKYSFYNDTQENFIFLNYFLSEDMLKEK